MIKHRTIDDVDDDELLRQVNKELAEENASLHDRPEVVEILINPEDLDDDDLYSEEETNLLFQIALEEEMIESYENPAKEKHRVKLKLGEIPYKVAYNKGFFGIKNPYKRNSRLWKAYEAGKRARD